MKIEKDIPIPPARNGHGVTAILRQLEVGDSFLLPLGYNHQSVYQASHYIAILVSKRPVVVDGVTRHRVWRVR